MNEFITGMAAGAVLFSGFNFWVGLLGCVAVGTLSVGLRIRSRKLEAQAQRC